MSLLHYITYKLVVIRDKRLGAVYYAIAACILLFTCVEIFVFKGYLEYDVSPEGTMRILVSDRSDDLDSSTIDTSTLPDYCCRQDGKNDKKNCGHCDYIDAQDMSWPIESHTINLMTYAKDRWQVKHRNNTLLRQKFVKIRETKYFTINPEDVLIKIEHSIVATRFTRKTGKEEVAASQRSLKGHLHDSSGRKIKSMSSDNAKDPGRGQADKLTVRELLNAAGVSSLDVPSDALNAKGKSYRRHGIVLHVGICYHNAEHTWIGTGDIEYSYHVRRIPYADYRINQVIPVISEDDFSTVKTDDVSSAHDKADARLFRKRYGIKIEFHQSGKLGRFSLPSFLLKLASGVGLLTLTATIVDTAALYLLPDRFRYRRFVYEESPVIEKDKKDNKEESPAIEKKKKENKED